MGAPEASPYESARNQRIEENKKRLQELGLTDLSKNLMNSVTPTKFSPDRKPRGLKEKVKVQLRRSTRNLDGPQPDYVEVEIDIRRRARFDNTGVTRHYSRLYERKYASEEARMCATEKAEALKKQLPQRNVSFVKPMLQSHVTGGFWLGLSVAFCRDHLPKRDDRIVLEDENNEEWETIYLANKTGLSGGWRGFSLDHGLVDGDALVFELVQPRRFKVHIIRVYGSNATITSNEEEQELQEDVKGQGPKSDEKGSCNKVRQRLIWETEHEKSSDVKEDIGFGASEVKCDIGKVVGIRKQEERSGDMNDGYESKPDVHLAQHNRIIKKEIECDAGMKDAKNVDLLNINSHDSQHLMSFKRPKKNDVLDDNFTVKKEMETGDDDGLDDVKDVVRLFESNSGNMRAKDITSYMRSKKHIDLNVKDRDTVRRRMRQGVLGGFSH